MLLFTAPESSGKPPPDADFPTGLDVDDEDEDEEDCAGACAQSAGDASKIATQLQRQPRKIRRKPIPPC
jgi:hypothetical protein